MSNTFTDVKFVSHGSRKWSGNADSNSTSVYSRCRNKPRILNIYENLYIYSIYLTSMILADENFPDSRYGANMTQDETRVKGKGKIYIYIYELIL